MEDRASWPKPRVCRAPPCIEAIWKKGRNVLNRPPGRIRNEGGGRKKLTRTRPELSMALERLVEPTTRGDPENPLRWTCRGTRQLAAALGEQGYALSHQTVASLLDELGYSLQGNRKTQEGSAHPDRDAQFRYIHGRVETFQNRGQPVTAINLVKSTLFSIAYDD